MVAVSYSTIRNNLKNYCDKATENNETVIVTRKDEKIASGRGLGVCASDAQVKAYGLALQNLSLSLPPLSLSPGHFEQLNQSVSVLTKK